MLQEWHVKIFPIRLLGYAHVSGLVKLRKRLAVPGFLSNGTRPGHPFLSACGMVHRLSESLTLSLFQCASGRFGNFRGMCLAIGPLSYKFASRANPCRCNSQISPGGCLSKCSKRLLVFLRHLFVKIRSFPHIPLKV